MCARPEEETVQYLDRLFDTGDYETLENVLHPLARFYFADDVTYTTPFLDSIYHNDARLFRHILTTQGIGVMDAYVYDDETAWGALERLTDEGGGWGTRSTMVLYEILLDEGASEDLTLDGDAYKCLGHAWEDSKRRKLKSISAVVWCCKNIRADGIEELVGKRMLAGSTWDYEPPMKRCKF